MRRTNGEAERVNAEAHDPGNMDLPERIVRALADGRFRSGSALGKDFGVSRAAIWQAIGQIVQWGVEIHAVRGKGYRLAHPFSPLDHAKISTALARSSMALEIVGCTDSTNKYLMQKLAALESGHVCLAEYQTDGKGRRGRQWHAAYGSSILVSFYWQFRQGPAKLGGLSLAVGVAAAEALTRCGIDGIGIKWPNDIVRGGKKLAGILIEISGESDGPSNTVVGMGVNVSIENIKDRIDQPSADLTSCGADMDRNMVASDLIGSILAALPEYEAAGLDGFAERWRRYDILRGREVVMHLPGEVISGRAVGIDSGGLLEVKTDMGIRKFSYGDVTLRMASAV